MGKARFYGYSMVLLLLGLLSLTTIDWVNQAFFKARFSYPAPLIPEWSLPAKEYTVEDLLPYAMRAVEQTYGRSAIGPINQGDKILVIAAQSQDKIAWEAMKTAMLKKGAAQADLITYDQLPRIGRNPGWTEPHPDPQVRNFGRALRYGKDGYLEWERLIVNEPGADIGQRNMSAWLLLNWTRSDPNTTKPDPNLWKQYDKIYALDAGPFARRYLAPKWKAYWLYERPQDLLFPYNSFPADVWKLIDDKVYGYIQGGVAEIRHTDPEGTDISVVLNEAQSMLFAAEEKNPGHHFMLPRPPYFADKFEGVIAGTSNHWGFFPLLKLYFKDARIYKVEGGGKFGEKFKEYIKKYENIQWPGYRVPGFFFVTEDALGTNPKGGRPYWRLVNGTGTVYPNVDERNRSGVIHFGIGLECERSAVGDEACMKWAADNRMPFTHAPHVHIQFSTIQYKMRETAQWITMVDKGWVTTNDDPEVRALAAKYGSPEEVLKYEWIPIKPTINYPGSWEDYQQDPWKYVELEAAGRISRVSPWSVASIVIFWMLLALIWWLMYRSYRKFKTASLGI
ncbi:MAG: hypothetical protein HY644_03675 [Acidobacteria bacterium]|nr:hypothetical protein [Acidobacteriota bacterium]